MTETEKTKEELQHELEIRRHLERERQISDGKYAPIIVGTIVFGMMGAIALWFLSQLFKSIGT